MRKIIYHKRLVQNLGIFIFLAAILAIIIMPCYSILFSSVRESVIEEYDEKLTEILLPRVECVNEDPITDNNVIVSEIKKDNNMVDLRKIKNVYSSYKVFFVENEKKVEEICKKEKPNYILASLKPHSNFSNPFPPLFNEKRRIILLIYAVK